MHYIARNKVRMHDTDMAGRLYFPRQYRFANDALEDLLEDEDLYYDKVFSIEKFVFVVVHSEADYYSLLKVGDELDVLVSCEKMGTTSFTILCQIYRNADELVGIVRTVHVSLDTITGQKIPLPEKLLRILKKYTVE